MQYAFFDLEIYKILTDMRNWPQQAPLGVTCAAVAFSDSNEVRFWSEPRPMLDKSAISQLITDLTRISQTHTIVTWNGANFDFQVLALEGGDVETCKSLALNHIDLMYLVYCQRGHFLGLDKCLAGCEVGSKVHEVTLSNGEVLRSMNGAMAPKLWQRGEYQAVLDYLVGDVQPPLRLIEYIRDNHKLRFTGFNGLQEIPCELMTVAAATQNIDHHWMTTEGERKKFLSWIYNGKKA